MTLPVSDTIVEYPTGAVENNAQVVHVEPIGDGRAAVLLDRTCSHPVDAGWPDQGPDRAVLVPHAGDASAAASTTDSASIGAHASEPTGTLAEADVSESAAVGAPIPVLDCVVGATDGSTLYLGRDIPVAKGTDGWAFVVAHIVDEAAAPRERDAVQVRVDADYRHALSAGHTGCHLAALALNRAMAKRWRKEVRVDAFGSPDFDAAANDTSTIEPNGSVDTYRLGKSLRKKGFVTEALSDDLAALEDAVNGALGEWIATSAPVRIDRDGEGLTDRRHWACELPEATPTIPCGGTHLDSLAGLAGLAARLSLTDVEGTPVLTMVTSRAV